MELENKMHEQTYLQLGPELVLTALELLDVIIARDCILYLDGSCTAQHREKGQHRVVRKFEQGGFGGTRSKSFAIVM